MKSSHEKIVLFLYGNRQYLEAEIRAHSFSFSHKNIEIETIVDEYSKRLTEYRAVGYAIVWLFWGQEHYPHLPDTNNFDKRLGDYSLDVCISCGISLGQEKNIYPDPLHILHTLRQMYPNLSRVVLGGFHRNDCVKRLQIAFDEHSDYQISVDDDLTELLFARSALKMFYPEDAKKILGGISFEK